eukprot:1569305-Amphidinium_carterae.1
MDSQETNCFVVLDASLFKVGGKLHGQPEFVATNRQQQVNEPISRHGERCNSGDVLQVGLLR